MSRQWWLLLALSGLLLGVAAWWLWRAPAGEDAAPAVFDAADLVGSAPEGRGQDPVDPSAAVDPTALRQEFPLAGATADPSAAPARFRIQGRVVDPAGVPVPGATVGLALRLTAQGGGTQFAHVRQRVTTTREGRFAFMGPRQQATAVLLWVLDTRHAPRVAEHECPPGTLLDVGDLSLCAGGDLVGQVVDAEARGLSAATVVLLPGSTHPLARVRDLAEILVPVATDAAGAYRFAHVLPGAYRVRASAAAAQTGSSGSVQVAEGRETQVEPIRLSPGAELVGRVLGPGDMAIPAATVRARGGRTTSGPDGRFRLGSLAPGLLAVEVRATGFLGWQRADVDPGKELTVRLEPGLQVSGVVTDAQSGRPVEQFAVKARRLRSALAGDGAGPGEQLRRKIADLRASAAGARDPEAAVREAALAAELEARARTLDGAEPVLRAPADLASPTARLGGRFVTEGLDEGVYVVDVLSPDHRFVRTAPFELRRGMPGAELQITAPRGLVLGGVVVGRPGGAPVAGALVELVRVREGDDLPRPEAPASPFAWMASATPPPGDILVATRSDERGRFEFRHAPPGRFRVTARHARHAAGSSAVLDLAAPPAELRITLGAAASLRGRVAGVPPGREGEARVLALGGSASLRTAVAGADGGYQLEGLEPGSYLVRPFLGNASEPSEEQVRAVLAAAGPTARPDVTLAEGESGALDLRLELPATGAVRGVVRVNGEPGTGCRAELHGSGPEPSRTVVPDARGEFAFAEVPVGEYSLRVTVQSPGGRQELYRESVVVSARGVAQVQAELRCGGLRGRVVAADGVPSAQLEGTLVVLPGAAAVPADLREYGRSHRVHELRVRGGAFRADALTVGPALLVLQLRGRNAVTEPVDLQAGAVRELELHAGAVR